MKKQVTVMRKIEIIREFMTKTGATIPEVIKSLEVSRKVTSNKFSDQLDQYLQANLSDF
jgi:hypothetical protein